MIDHLLGRPSPSWKRTQVRLFPQFHTTGSHLSHPGPSRHHLLDLEARIRKSWRTTLLVVKTVEQETPYVNTPIVSFLPLTCDRALLAMANHRQHPHHRICAQEPRQDLGPWL